MSLAVGIHELLELGGGLDLEEDLLAVLNREKSTWLLTLRLSCSVLAAVTTEGAGASDIELNYISNWEASVIISLQNIIS